MRELWNTNLFRGDWTHWTQDHTQCREWKQSSDADASGGEGFLTRISVKYTTQLIQLDGCLDILGPHWFFSLSSLITSMVCLCPSLSIVWTCLLESSDLIEVTRCRTIFHWCLYLLWNQSFFNGLFQWDSNSVLRVQTEESEKCGIGMSVEIGYFLTDGFPQTSRTISLALTNGFFPAGRLCVSRFLVHGYDRLSGLHLRGLLYAHKYSRHLLMVLTGVTPMGTNKPSGGLHRWLTNFLTACRILLLTAGCHHGR